MIHHHNAVFDAQRKEESIELPTEEAGGRKARILVVDDIDANRVIAETCLSDSGYRVDTVDNATEAIRLLQKERYDLVLMDIQMPVMDGVTATRCIRALPNAVKDIPIIAITANVLPQQVKSFLDAGMNAHIGKPFDLSRLRNCVRRWLPSTGGHEVSGARNSPSSDAPDVSGAVFVPPRVAHENSAAKLISEASKRHAQQLVSGVVA